MTEEENKQSSIMDDKDFMEFLTDNFGGIKNRLSDIESDVSELKTEVGILKTTMVTKSFMTDRLIDLKTETTEKLKKEDEKVEKITEKLGDKKVFNAKDIKEIKSIEVFPVLK